MHSSRALHAASRMEKIPRLLLFDIDGTLTKSNHMKIGGYYGSSLLEALSSVFKQEIKRNGIHFAGGTDPGITKAVLSSCNITPENCPGYREKVQTAFEMIPECAMKGVEEGRYMWNMLPGVNDLITALSKRDDIRLAILTGNIKPMAWLKLEVAGIKARLFTLKGDNDLFGAFGSDDGNRERLVEIAQERYCDFLGVKTISPNDLIVIGDTPKDISCAHANKTPCVAVTTGSYTREQLSEAECVLDGFQNIDECIKAFTTINYKE